MSHQNEKRSQAHNPWNQVFQTQGRVFEEPHPLLPTVVERLKANQAQNVLDLGAGTGRHVIFLASNGFTTYALDSAPEGLAQTQRWLSSVGLQATLLEHDIYQPLPFADQFFDSIVSIQVIHHARLHQIVHLDGRRQPAHQVISDALHQWGVLANQLVLVRLVQA